MSGADPITSYPWYVPDWQSSETRIRLSLAQRGLFRELLDYCHIEGSITDDPVLLARMCGASVKETKRLFPGIRDQFMKEGNRLVNPKASEVRAKILKFHAGRVESGTVGAKKRWAKSPQTPASFPAESSEHPASDPRQKPKVAARLEQTAMESANADGAAIADAWLTYSLPLPLPQPQPQLLKTCSTDVERERISSPKEPSALSRKTTPEHATERWGKSERSGVFRESFWPAWPRKVARADAEKAWVKHAATPELAEKIVQAAQHQREHLLRSGLEFCPYAASWLNSRRYEDDPTEASTAQSPMSTTKPPAAEWRPAWEVDHA